MKLKILILVILIVGVNSELACKNNGINTGNNKCNCENIKCRNNGILQNDCSCKCFYNFTGSYIDICSNDNYMHFRNKERCKYRNSTCNKCYCSTNICLKNSTYETEYCTCIGFTDICNEKLYTKEECYPEGLKWYECVKDGCSCEKKLCSNAFALLIILFEHISQ